MNSFKTSASDDSFKRSLPSAKTLLILLASGFYWAWFDATIFRPTLFMPFVNSQEFYSLYFMTAIVSSAGVLLLAFFQKKRKSKPLTSRKGITLLVSVLAGSLLTMLGAFLLNPLLVFFGALIIGASCSQFLLGWARIYSLRGARSACFYISGAITIGVLLDILIIGLSPLFAAVFAVALPLIFIWPLLNARNLGDSDNSSASTDTFPRIVPTDDDDRGGTVSNQQTSTRSLQSIFASSHLMVFGLSFSLVAAFFIFGFSFGFMQFNTAFTSPELYPFSSDALLVSRGVTSFIVFLALYFFPKQIYTVFRAGILIGIGGFIAVPFLSTLANYNLIIGFFIAIGYTTFDIITWTLLSELSVTTGKDTKATFGPGRFVVHISIFIGFLAALLIASNPQTFELQEAFYATIGYLLVVAEMLLLSENSALWMLIRSRVPAENEAAPELGIEEGDGGYGSRNIAHLIDAYNLTDREVEILRLLIIGRSRPRIAQILCISENTVSSHIQHIYHKLDVHGLQELLDLFS